MYAAPRRLATSQPYATPHGLPQATPTTPMTPPDARWLKAHSGPLSTRRMAAAIDRIAAFIHGKDHLAVTKIAEQHDPYAVLVSTLISLRTRDEVTDLVSPRLLAESSTPEALARTPPERIARLIH